MIKKINTHNVKYVYIHIPFCRSFCDYCAFYKESYSDEKFYNYINSLEDEMNNNVVISKIKTLYIGGGTPNTLSIKNLKKIFTLIKMKFKFCDNYEFTIECNPSDITKEKILLFIKNNVNRLSIGIQSTNQKIIDDVSRIQTSKDIEKSLKILKECKFENYSFDFIYNLPNQTLEDIVEDINFIKTTKPPHISWYSLILKKGTPLKKRYKKIDQDKDFEFGNYIEKNLQKIGYKRYEISNYTTSKKKESVHNTAYWTSKLFIAYGPSGSSFLYNEENEKYYLKKNINQLGGWYEKRTNLEKSDYYFQIMMMGLRLINGINITKKPYSMAYKYYFDKINKEIKNGFLKITNNHLKCTNEGLLFLNDVLIRLL